MTAPNMYGDVAAFHKRFNQEYTGQPRHLPADVQQFRHKFQNEEAQEYLSAIAAGDAHSALDAIVDQIYVLLGTAYLMGVNFDEAWKRVHAKNMEKIPAADGTLKIRKPEGWFPPDLSDLVPRNIELHSSDHFEAWLGVLAAEANRRAISLADTIPNTRDVLESAFIGDYSPFDVLNDHVL